MKVQKGVKEDKVATVMREFSEGKLKSSSGQPVTDKNQALAIALSAAGLSKKSLQKAEILSKAKVLKAQLTDMIQKELDTGKSLQQELIGYFKSTNAPKDEEVHAIAEKHGASPADVEQLIYKILADFFRGGKSKGSINPVDQNEFELGMKEEKEHTDNPILREKIVRDHLAKDPKFYSKEKAVEKAKIVEGYESPEPGDLPKEKADKLAAVYASCRKDGGDKEKCAKIAWAAVNKSEAE